MNDAVLARLDIARAALEKADTVDEIKQIADIAAAAIVFARRVNRSVEVINKGLSIKTRAERKLGQAIKDGQERGELRKAGGSGDSVKSTKSFEDLGIDSNQSRKSRTLAAIPDDVFEETLAQVEEAPVRLNESEILRIASALKAKKVKRKKPGLVYDVNKNESAICSLESLIADGSKFGTIYADPPWRYGNQGTRAATDNHYVTMTPAEIAALPIASLAAEQAHLHLWTTNAFLFDSKAIIEAWGFEYKSVFVWVKPQMGIGNYWRVSHELMLLGVRGGLTFPDKNMKSWIEASRTKHSSKPAEIRKLIERASPGPRLELFGRQTSPGWTVWGNEIEKTLFNGEAFANG